MNDPKPLIIAGLIFIVLLSAFGMERHRLCRGAATACADRRIGLRLLPAPFLFDGLRHAPRGAE